MARRKRRSWSWMGRKNARRATGGTHEQEEGEDDDRRTMAAHTQRGERECTCGLRSVRLGGGRCTLAELVVRVDGSRDCQRHVSLSGQLCTH